MAKYTNRHKRQNFIRESCHQYIKERMPFLYAQFRAEAAKLFEDQRKSMIGKPKSPQTCQRMKAAWVIRKERMVTDGRSNAVGK